jgi:two-component system, chemotaxis family, sensor kinase CheA
MSTVDVMQTFMLEGRELLEKMENTLLLLDPTAADPEAVNELFRGAHTIKGSAGLFGLDHLVGFVHELETTLDAVRNGSLPFTDDLVSLFLRCNDHVGSLLDGLEAHEEESAESARDGAELVRELRARLGAATKKVEVSARAKAVEEPAPSVSADDLWHLSLRFGPNELRSGFDPLAFLQWLQRLGKVRGVLTMLREPPEGEPIDPSTCYLHLEVAFESREEKFLIESVFDFVRETSDIRILPPQSRVGEYVELIRQLPEEAMLLGEMLVRCGTLTARELDSALEMQKNAPEKLGELLVARNSVHPQVVEAALNKQQKVRAAQSQEGTSIRVDSDKLDHLINLVGELIIASARTDIIARKTRNDDLSESTSNLAALVKEIRDSALQLRMVKIGPTFNRFQRVVRDVSAELGKEIALVVDGEDTELDKTVVERIGDPLTHLVRNASDHGIESPEVRLSRGKPARGTVTLNAYHDSGSIVIEVSDDGGGLKREKILAKALERGLIEPGKVLTDSEVFALIFEPGFSTADQVTNLSGRGVGMDVVKRNIQALRGSVSIASQEGVGTTVTVRLPLTLAIINGFLVGLGKSTFVVPLEMIEECVEFSAQPGHHYTNLRGTVLPFIRLRELFDVQGNAPRENIVVVRHAGQRAGLVVDSLLGEFQAVIKPMNKVFNRVKCISGSSILGTGEVALILDVPTLVSQAGQSYQSAPEPQAQAN